MEYLSIDNDNDIDIDEEPTIMMDSMMIRSESSSLSKEGKNHNINNNSIVMMQEGETTALLIDDNETLDSLQNEVKAKKKNYFFWNQRWWNGILLGQAIALVAASMSSASYTLSHHFGFQAQLFLLFLLYVCLCSFMLVRQKEMPPVLSPTTLSLSSAVAEAAAIQSEQQPPPPPPKSCHFLPLTRIRLRVPWYVYFFISLLDVVPNFMALLAFNYTSLTSTTLLGSLTVPATMFFSRHVLSRSFAPRHYVGVCLCVVGGALAVWSDTTSSSSSSSSSTSTGVVVAAMGASSSSSSHSYIGDALAVAAALMYGLGDTVAEYFVKNVDRAEYLGMLGVFGAIFTGLTFPWLEGPALMTWWWQQQQHQRDDTSSSPFVFVVLAVVATIIWYVASVFFYYTTEALFLVTSDATLLNLSMQATNLWVIAFSIIVYHEVPGPTFYVALLLVMSGVFVYESEMLGSVSGNGSGGSARVQQGGNNNNECSSCSLNSNNVDDDVVEKQECQQQKDEEAATQSRAVPLLSALAGPPHSNYQGCRIEDKHSS